jgi:Alkylmercury lyase
VDQADLDLRNATYRRFVELGRAPTPAEVAATIGRSAEAVSKGWRQLHDGHALVLDADGAIAMLNPFAARPTPFRVEADGRSWFANCGWDAFGIGSALAVDSVIHTACADCAEPITINVRGGLPVETSPVFHVLVPAAQWWNNIGFT